MQPDVPIIDWHKVCLSTNMVPNALDRLIDPLKNARNPQTLSLRFCHALWNLFFDFIKL
jgi:hypothetical protein